MRACVRDGDGERGDALVASGVTVDEVEGGDDDDTVSDADGVGDWDAALGLGDGLAVGVSRSSGLASLTGTEDMGLGSPTLPVKLPLPPTWHTSRVRVGRKTETARQTMHDGDVGPVDKKSIRCYCSALVTWYRTAYKRYMVAFVASTSWDRPLSNSLENVRIVFPSTTLHVLFVVDDSGSVTVGLAWRGSK